MKITDIICVFQNKQYLAEFCEHNGFPMIARNCREFDVHTFKQKLFKKDEACDIDEFFEKTSKFIKPANTDKKIVPYAERCFPMWRGMPKLNGYSFESGRGNGEYAKIIFKFRPEDDIELAKKIFWWVNVTEKTKNVKFADERFKWQTSHVIAIDYDNVVRQPRYPVYVISKGRSYLKDGTSGVLSELGIKHYVVVEPDELQAYEENIANDYATIIPMDMKYIDEYDRGECLGDDTIVGPGAKRNFIWDHSTEAGYKWHWVLDDNAYYMKNRFFNYRFYSKTANFMSACEDYVDMFKNIGQAGIDYNFFYPDNIKDVPYIQNTRCFSFILNNNFITNKEGKHYRWAGRYSEDVDLSLRILKDGWCTTDFRICLLQKAKTQTCAGGCNGEIYAKEGTDNKSIFIAHRHPDCCEVVQKYGRTHHYVNYHIFQQQLELKDEWKDKFDKLPLVNDYGVCLIAIDDEDSAEAITREEVHKKYADRIKGPQQYIYVDAENATDEQLEKALDEVLRDDRSPIVLTDVYTSNAVNNISRIARERHIPVLNYLYCYNETLNLEFNENLYDYDNVAIITHEGTKLYKQLPKLKIEKQVII